MKKTTLFLISILMGTFSLHAQHLRENFVSSDREIKVEEEASFEIKNLFPGYLDGIVYTNDKETSRQLNYHVMFDVFYTTDRRGTRVFLRPEGIDSIRVNNLLFKFYSGHGYFEVVSREPGLTLLRKYGIDISSESLAVGAYGSTARSQSAQSVQSLVRPGMGDFVDRTVKLENPAGQELHVSVRRVVYFSLMSTDGNPVRINNRRSLQREFPEFRSDIRSFLRQNNTDFDQEQDMIELTRFLGSLIEG